MSDGADMVRPDAAPLPVREPSLRYRIVRGLSGIFAFFSVPLLLGTVGSLFIPAMHLNLGDGRPLSVVSTLVECAIAIPVYRAIKQRRRAGLMALLFGQVGVILQKTIAAWPAGDWISVLLSLVWLGILLSIRDELDQ